VRFAAPENIETKRATGLRDVEPPDVSAWFERLAAPHRPHADKLTPEDAQGTGVVREWLDGAEMPEIGPEAAAPTKKKTTSRKEG